MIDENGIILFKTFNRIPTKYKISQWENFSICNALHCNAGHFSKMFQPLGLIKLQIYFVEVNLRFLTFYVFNLTKMSSKKSFHFNLDALASQTIYLNLHKCFIWQIPRDWNFTCQRHPFVENWEIQIKPISKPMNRESRVLCIDAVILYVNLCPAIFWC